jgi:phosphate transport system protein
MDEVQDQIVDMAELVGEQLTAALEALSERDLELAQEVAHADHEVNDVELQIEERCLQLLALQQPMASDLRHISTMLKIITDLERMGDHAKDIARIVIRMKQEPLLKPLVDVPRMVDVCSTMLSEAMEAYCDEDVEKALTMVERDHELDQLYNQIFRELLTYMIEDPRHIRQATHLLFIASHLERFGDHATNLGEWVVFLVTGERRDLNE